MDHEFCCCVVLFEGNFDALFRQETIGQHFPMNCSNIFHSFIRSIYNFIYSNLFHTCLTQGFGYEKKAQKLSPSGKIMGVFFRLATSKLMKGCSVLVNPQGLSEEVMV